MQYVNSATPIEAAKAASLLLDKQSIMSTLEFSDDVHLFFHDFTSIPEFLRYEKWLPSSMVRDERALVLAREKDIVLTRSPVDRKYLEFLNGLGIGPAEERVICNPDRVRELLGSSRCTLNPYVLTDREVTLSKRIGVRAVGSVEIVRHANQKHLALSKARELGVPIAPGDFVFHTHSKMDQLIETIEKFRTVTGKVFVRAPEGFSGSAQLLVDDKAINFEEELYAFSDNTTLLVQVFLPVTVSPNILLHICQDTGNISCAAVCDQRLDKQLAHYGNIFPSLARTLPQMMDSAYRLCEWLRSERYAGFVGFDFCEYDDESGMPRYFLAEINPRVNGSAYASALMERTGSGACLSGALSTRARTFVELTEELGCDLYDRSKGTGIIPYNIATLPQGKFSFAVLGSSRNEVEDLSASLENRQAKN